MCMYMNIVCVCVLYFIYSTFEELVLFTGLYLSKWLDKEIGFCTSLYFNHDHVLTSSIS